MKKTFLLSLLAIALLGMSFIIDPSPIVGRWEHTFKDGPVTFLVVFRADGSYDGFANKKAFVSGTYQMKHDTLYISDPTCNNKYAGTYTVEYFGRQDSIKFHVIQDTCVGRREGADGLVYKHVKATGK